VERSDQGIEGSDGAVIPLVQLVEGVRLLPQQCTTIQVHSDGGYRAATMTALEIDSGVADLGLKIEPCLMEFTDGAGHLMISNPMDFTQKLTHWNPARY